MNDFPSIKRAGRGSSLASADLAATIVKPSILLAEDHQLVAEGVSALLSRDFRVVGREIDGRAIVDRALLLRPDIVILDISMPGASGLDAARRIHESEKGIRVIMLTHHTEWAYVHAAFGAGASGYVVKTAPVSELREAVDQVLKGRSYISQSLERRRFPLARAPAQTARTANRGLSPRQHAVLKLIASGMTAKEMAAVLKISVKTVEYHKAAIMKKLELRTTAELAVYAYQQGLVH
jgi:DNA-binding NarL/FixJ family response regulator